MTAYEELMEYAREHKPELYRAVCREEYEDEHGRHFNQEYGEDVVSRMHHTNADGSVETGEHWTMEQTRTATNQWRMKLPAGTTDYDIYVAMNMWWHDLGQNYRRRSMATHTENIAEDAITWAFLDQDAPEGKLWLYIAAMDA